MTIKACSRGRTHYNIYKDKGLKIKIIYKDFKNKNNFRFKEGKFILGLPYSHKLYEYLWLYIHWLLWPYIRHHRKQRDEAGWRSLLHSPTYFTVSAYFNHSTTYTTIEPIWNLRTRALMKLAYLKLRCKNASNTWILKNFHIYLNINTLQILRITG